MKQLLLQYAKYNVWANKRIVDVLLKLDTSLLVQEMVSSFPTLSTTALHIWSAEAVWLQRLELVEQPVWYQNTFTGSFPEICTGWQKASEGLQVFVERQFDDRAFEHVLQYYNMQKRSVKLPVHTVLTHAFNHSSYHRGQLTTMLRQVGVEKIPSMDMLIYAT